MGTADHATAPLGGVGVGQGIYVYVEDVDAYFARARAGGAQVSCTRWKTLGGEHAAIAYWIRKGTSGASVATDLER
jgi:uncharacterized glyoxalase superfamily protein PhnB